MKESLPEATQSAESKVAGVGRKLKSCGGLADGPAFGMKRSLLRIERASAGTAIRCPLPIIRV